MIQRIQSLFLFLSACGFGSLFFLPFGTSSMSYGSIFQNSSLDLQDNIGLLILAVLGGLLAVLSIFLYNNRKLQIIVASIGTIMALPLIGLAYWLFSSNAPTDAAISSSLAAGLITPIASFIFGLLGVNFIKKDDNLVKSMDRLR